jgi:N-acetylgalactosamine kinase
VLERFREAYGDLPCSVYRAPSRISLNPHSDHQGAWVPYGCHSRELLTAVALTDDDRVEIVNTDSSFAERLSFSVDEEIGRAPVAWREGWQQYIEAPEVVQSVRGNLDRKGQPCDRHATVNYVKAGVLHAHYAAGETALPGLRLAFNGDIPQGGGLSSSSALVVTAALILAEHHVGDPDRRKLAEDCGLAEWYVGTRGGSGDHAAILLGSREGLTHLRFDAPVAVRDQRRSRFPAGYQLILANSQTRSEKSAEERLLFNRGIFAYKFAFLALREAMSTLGLPASVIEETHCLGDLHTGRIAEADLYRLVLQLPEYASAGELAKRFPHTFSSAARGCFGTDDLGVLTQRIPLRGAAVYGLGRADRGCHMPSLLEEATPATMAEFGRLMTITHDGDRLYRHGDDYRDSRKRVTDDHLLSALDAVVSGAPRPLRHEPGFYGASISELDRMVDIALGVRGVEGAGLMGAGGGGYVLILAREGAFESLRKTLVREYYKPLGKEPELEAWQSSAAACRLL